MNLTFVFRLFGMLSSAWNMMLDTPLSSLLLDCKTFSLLSVRNVFDNLLSPALSVCDSLGKLEADCKGARKETDALPKICSMFCLMESFKGFRRAYCHIQGVAMLGMSGQRDDRFAAIVKFQRVSSG